MIKTVKIPKARIAILIGEKGQVKKHIQKELPVSLNINSETGEVDIKGEDALQILSAENTVKAIGRGFEPETAFELFEEENALEIIQLPKEEKQLHRIKARIIGEDGRARENLERLTGCSISVYGRTVSIIGEYERVEKARDAVLQLMKGFTHASVYAMLEKGRKQY